MKDREQFLATRRTGLGGSDIGTIVGHGFKSEVDLWLRKTGQIDDDDENLAMAMGTYLEDFVARRYELKTDRRVVRFNKTLRCARFPVLLAHVDRLVIPEGAKVAAVRGEIRTDRLLECKTSNMLAANDRERWGEEYTDEVPLGYWFQVKAYLGMAKVQYGDLMVVFGNSSERLYTLEADDEVYEMVGRKCTEWWQKHIIEGIPPEPKSDDDVLALYGRKDNGETVEADDEIAAKVATLKELKQRLKADEAAIEALEIAIKSKMAGAATLVYHDAPLCTWKGTKPRETFDLDFYLSSQYPGVMPEELAGLIRDIKSSYRATGNPSRQFRLK